MDKSRDECLGCVQKNINEIRKLLKQLPDGQIDLLFEEIHDVLFFYGFKRRQIEKYIRYPELSYGEFTDEKLLEFEGVTNALLYNLKYKM